MTQGRESPPLDKGGAPKIIDGESTESDCSTRYKYPSPDFVPNYAAAIDCPLACSPSCPFRCPLVLGGVR